MNPEDIIEALLQEHSMEMPNTDEVLISQMAQTNAVGYYCDDAQIRSAAFSNPSKDEIRFRATLHFSGDHDGEDRPFCGDAVTVEAEGTAMLNGGKWQLDEFSRTASIDDYLS